MSAPLPQQMVNHCRNFGRRVAEGIEKPEGLEVEDFIRHDEIVAFVVSRSFGVFTGPPFQSIRDECAKAAVDGFRERMYERGVLPW